MQKRRGNLINGVGSRLKQVRKQLDLSPGRMATLLGINTISYFKNEGGTNIPGMISLHRLHNEFKVSMDWLLFNHGDMFLPDPTEVAAEKEKAAAEKEKAAAHDNIPPEIKELLAHMDDDPLLRHELLVQFCKYKKQDENKE